MDNAATTYPKPECVAAAVLDFMTRIGASAGRSGHSLSIESGRIVYEARETIADMFNSGDAARVIFTMNATAAINTALHGYLHDGGHVVTTSFEHNSVMRPLRNLAESGKITLGTTNADLDDLRRKSKNAKLIAVVHGNNVTGKVTDLAAVSAVAKENGCAMLVDAAQTAGLIDIDVSGLGIDFLCFSGHKGLYGPQGTGALIIGKNIDHKKMKTIIQGGTGSLSEYERHPEALPDKFEAGTMNCAGIAGLAASVRWLSSLECNHEIALRNKLYEGLVEVPNLKLHAATPDEPSTNVLSFTIDGKRVSDIGMALDEQFNIMARVGLHCAPAAHKLLGTFPEGTVRLSTGAFSTNEDVDYVIDAIKEIAKCR